MLPVVFTLLGLIGWVRGREIAVTDARRGAAWMCVAMAGGTLLAFLSKANGALLPLLAWVLDVTVLRDTRDAGHVRTLRRALTWLPSAAIVAYLLIPLLHANAPIAGRTWTVAERLMTQPRVLLDYLQLLAVPRVLSTGVYNDAYVLSTRLFAPATTLPAILAIVGMIVAAGWARARTPALSAAVLFFFAGHIVESTTIPLELYFEHRNYLPAMLAFWPLGLAIARWQASPAVRTGAAALALALFAFVTWQRAGLWGDQPRMAQLWAARSPDSSRAQATAASFDIRANHADAALARLLPLWAERPIDLQLALNAASAYCAQGELPGAAIPRIAQALRGSVEGDVLVHRWLERSLTISGTGSCKGTDRRHGAALRRCSQCKPDDCSALPGRRQDLESLQGRLALRRGDAAAAARWFDRALLEEPRPGVAAMHAAILAERQPVRPGHRGISIASPHFLRRLPT
jgi:hypothetical protein